MAQPRKIKVSKAQAALLFAWDKKEPEPKDYSVDERQLAKDMDWYKHFVKPEKAAQYVAERLAKSEATSREGAIVAKFDAISVSLLGLAFAWHCRMLDRGCTLPEATLAYGVGKLAEIDSIYEKQQAREEAAAKRRGNRPKKASAAVKMILDLDKALETEESITAVMIRNLALKHAANQGDCAVVAEHYAPRFQEVEALVAIGPTDRKKHERSRKKLLARMDVLADREFDLSPTEAAELEKIDRDLAVLAAADLDMQLDEAYSGMDKAARNKLLESLRAIVQSSKQTLEVLRRERAAKAKPKKAVPADKQVAGMRWLTEDKEAGIASLHPRELLGKKKAWIWYSKYKKIVCWESDTGFGAHGMAVTNTKTVRAKTVRKPQEFFLDFAQGNAARREKLFVDLKTGLVAWGASRMGDGVLIIRVE